ncbi:Sec-independent protein translocase subunit TatA/TatB [Propionicicella superfundia]|uniref:Sec-independent protein translocase subunit TatA/TatB n=1 Tax=Propionicicella superfundia TaxID=348582 RepID=UPI0003FDE75A|nr:twin-arginine translocase TatA/TatE family subunit [Propionicicella superfundia]
MGLPGGMEWVIIALVALLIFGGTAGARLAGLGKGAGRAIREFKEETQGLSAKDAKEKAEQAGTEAAPKAVEAEPPSEKPND